MKGTKFRGEVLQKVLGWNGCVAPLIGSSTLNLYMNLKSKMGDILRRNYPPNLRGFGSLLVEMTQLYTWHTNLGDIQNLPVLVALLKVFLGSPDPKNANSWWSLGQGTNLGAHTFSSWPIGPLAPGSESFILRFFFVGPTRLSKQRGSKDLRFLAQKWRHTLETWTILKPKVMEVWKMIFHLKWGDF